MNILNADTQQVRTFSKYPFDQASTMQIYNYTVKSTWIPSIGICVQQAKFPLYISGFTHNSATTCKLHVSDNTATEIAYAVLYRQRSTDQTAGIQSADKFVASLVDVYGHVCGQLMYDVQFSGFILNVLTTEHLGQIALSANNLILSPQCITCTHTVGCKQVVFNGKYKYKGSTTLIFQRNVTLTDSGIISTPAINVYGDKDTTDVSDIAYQVPKYLKYVNGKDLSGSHVLIKPSALSDLRVITNTGTITFSGVRNA